MQLRQSAAMIYACARWSPKAKARAGWSNGSGVSSHPDESTTARTCSGASYYHPSGDQIAQ